MSDCYHGLSEWHQSRPGCQQRGIMRLMCYHYRLEWFTHESFQVWIPMSGIGVKDYIYEIYPLHPKKKHLIYKKKYLKNCYKYWEGRWPGGQLSGRAVVLVCKTGGQTSGRADVREGKCPFTNKKLQLLSDLRKRMIIGLLFHLIVFINCNWTMLSLTANTYLSHVYFQDKILINGINNHIQVKQLIAIEYIDLYCN